MLAAKHCDYSLSFRTTVMVEGKSCSIELASDINICSTAYVPICINYTQKDEHNNNDDEDDDDHNNILNELRRNKLIE